MEQKAHCEWPFPLCILGLCLVPTPGAASISYLQGVVPGSQRCPRGYRQAAHLCVALPAIPPGSARTVSQQPGTRAELSQQRINFTGSGCAWPGWPPKPTVSRGLKGWGGCNVMFTVLWLPTQDLTSQAIIVAGTLRAGHYTCTLQGPQFSFCWGK